MLLTDSRNDIENEVTEQYPRISPSVGVIDVQWYEEFVANLVLAVTTCGGIIWIVQVS